MFRKRTVFQFIHLFILPEKCRTTQELGSWFFSIKIETNKFCEHSKRHISMRFFHIFLLLWKIWCGATVPKLLQGWSQELTRLQIICWNFIFKLSNWNILERSQRIYGNNWWTQSFVLGNYFFGMPFRNKEAKKYFQNNMNLYDVH